VHPHAAQSFETQTATDLRALASAHPGVVVAIGECGLDYYRDLSSRPAQRRCFQMQLALAVELHLPVFLHDREAHADFLPMLREFRAGLPGAIVHCFTGSEAELAVNFFGLKLTAQCRPGESSLPFWRSHAAHHRRRRDAKD
jgi:TatD DNase family protein